MRKILFTLLALALATPLLFANDIYLEPMIDEPEEEIIIEPMLPPDDPIFLQYDPYLASTPPVEEIPPAEIEIILPPPEPEVEILSDLDILLGLTPEELYTEVDMSEVRRQEIEMELGMLQSEITEYTKYGQQNTLEKQQAQQQLAIKQQELAQLKSQLSPNAQPGSYWYNLLKPKIDLLEMDVDGLKTMISHLEHEIQRCADIVQKAQARIAVLEAELASL